MLNSNGVRPLVIVGASGFGREVACIVEDINRVSKQWDFMGFVDDALKERTVEGHKILGPISILDEISPKPFIVIAIADTRVRFRIAKQLEEKYSFATLIHPSVTMSKYVSIGSGTIICRNTILTTNIKIGQHCIINVNCSFGHDTKVCNFVSIMSHTAIAGDVKIGEGCYFGLSCTVINQLNIGKWSKFGAGAVVTKDMPSKILAVGVPARVIKNLDDH